MTTQNIDRFADIADADLTAPRRCAIRYTDRRTGERFVTKTFDNEAAALSYFWDCLRRYAIRFDIIDR